MRAKINLDTISDVQKFVKITTALNGKITVTDGKGLVVNAKSLMGLIYSLEFEELWCESEFDIWRQISEFIVEE